MENEREIQQIKNRFRELADKAFSQNMFTFTGFLGLSEQSVFWQMERELGYAGFTLFGGREDCDRKMLRFGDEGAYGYDVDFPIVCLHIRPLTPKFADHLTHRDYLGALMNLGIERSTVGDILAGETESYLFCTDAIADFICAELRQVKHTNVVCERVKDAGEVVTREPAERTVQVPSMRADAVIAKVYNKSRESTLELFRMQKVFVDGRLCENNSRQLRVNETVNARGYGKFVLCREPAETRKGKLSLTVKVYE